MTVNSFIEKVVEKNPNQIVTIYDDKHNITYHGKADFAPLTLWMEYRNSQTENCIDIKGNPTTNLIINGEVEETTEEVSIMADYMIIATVNGVDYLTKVSAESESSAEHAILDLGVCGKHDYSVTACMAYDAKSMKTDTFVYNALNALPLGFNALVELIEQRNAQILSKDAAEEKIRDIEKQMKELQMQLNEAKAILRA